VASVTRAAHIDAPRDRVFALVADPAKLIGSDSRIGRVDVERDAGGPRRVRVQFSAGAGPSPAGMEIVADVTRYVPDSDFAVASPEGAPGPAFRLNVQCRDADGGTDVTCEMELRMPGVAGRLADPLLGAALTQQLNALLARVEREAVRPST
jgi:Polyketide cyclase / dehydrase and lipid transport